MREVVDEPQHVSPARSSPGEPGRGRPGRGPEASQVVTVRLTPEELESLDRIAAEKHLSRSEVMRQAITAITAA